MSSDTNDDGPSDLAEEVDQLKRVVAAQAEEIEALKAKLDGETDAGEGDGNGTFTAVNNWFSRRSLIQALGVAGLAGYGTGVATAEPTGQIGTADKPLRMLYTQEIGAGIVDDNEISSLLGTGLSVEEDALSAAEAADDHVDVADSGSAVTDDAEEIDFGENLSASDNDGSVAVDGQNPSVDDSGSNVTDDVDTFDFQDNLNLNQQDDGTIEVDAVDTTIENTDSNTHTDVSDGGSTVVSSTDDINFGSNISVSDDGDGSVTVTGTSGGSWSDSDSNSLLEPSGSETGIEVTDVNTDNLTDNGSGQVSLGNTFDLNGNNLSDGNTTIWNQSNSQIPQGRLENTSVTVAGNSVSLGSSTSLDYTDLNDTGSTFPIPNGDLNNSSVTVTAGNGLKNGGSVSLGGTTTLDIEPADFAGTFLSDDGSDNLQVDTGSGLEDDGSGNIQTRGDELAGNVLSEGSNPYAVDISIGNGLEDNSGTLRVNPGGIAGNGLTESGGTNLDIASGGVGTNELATNFADLATLFGTPVTAGANLDVSGASKLSLPQVSSDPSASAGDMWYRTDLD